MAVEIVGDRVVAAVEGTPGLVLETLAISKTGQTVMVQMAFEIASYSPK